MFLSEGWISLICKHDLKDACRGLHGDNEFVSPDICCMADAWMPAPSTKHDILLLSKAHSVSEMFRTVLIAGRSLKHLVIFSTYQQQQR